jgi:Sec-independent protein secretion pathway component TatC
MMFIIIGVVVVAVVGISIWIGRWIERRKKGGK